MDNPEISRVSNAWLALTESVGGAMISNQAKLEQAILQLYRMYRALAALRAEIPQASPQFELLAEGPKGEIEQLRVEIEEYLAPPAAHADA